MRPNLFLIGILIAAALCDGTGQRPQQTAGDDQPPLISKSSSPALSFNAFKHKYRKTYSSLAEQSYRQLVYESNLQALNKHNSNPHRKYNMKPNAFMDVTEDEFRSVYGTVYIPDQHSKTVSNELTKSKDCRKANCRPKDTTSQSKTEQQSISLTKEGQVAGQAAIENDVSKRRLQMLTLEADLLGSESIGPESSSGKVKHPAVVNQSESIQEGKGILIDWSAYSGPVRFQGFCGACYAFATIDTVSSHLAIYSYGFFFQLSVQQIIDCADNGLTFGCYGGYL